MADLRINIRSNDRLANKHGSLEALGGKLSALEQKIIQSQQETEQRYGLLKKEVENSLDVCERKCKKLDHVYRSAHVENELLYDRFNSELAKVFQNLQAGGVEALLAKLKEAQSEVARLKSENFRLKRENIGLTSQLGQ